MVTTTQKLELEEANLEVDLRKSREEWELMDNMCGDVMARRNEMVNLLVQV